METFPLLSRDTTLWLSSCARVNGWALWRQRLMVICFLFTHTHTHARAVTRSIRSNGKKRRMTLASIACTHSFSAEHIYFSCRCVFYVVIIFLLHIRACFGGVSPFTSVVKIYTYNLPFCRSSTFFVRFSFHLMEKTENRCTKGIIKNRS